MLSGCQENFQVGFRSSGTHFYITVERKQKRALGALHLSSGYMWHPAWFPCIQGDFFVTVFHRTQLCFSLNGKFVKFLLCLKAFQWLPFNISIKHRFLSRDYKALDQLAPTSLLFSLKTLPSTRGLCSTTRQVGSHWYLCKCYFLCLWWSSFPSLAHFIPWLIPTCSSSTG